MVKVAIDAMGGDLGPAPIIEGTLQALQEFSFKPILVGDKSKISPFVPKDRASSIEIVHSEDFIKMDEGATGALKRKDSSIYVASNLIKEGSAECVVSAGHSGATMSIATLKIGRVKGVLRPAIASHMPTVRGKNSLIVDAGANVDCKAEHLLQFALMGIEYMKCVMGIPNPSVGLLSNGEERSKGNELTKESYKLLERLENFKGNVEGANIFDGSVDVVVCDGFTGNIVLKTSEGVADAITTLLKQHIKSSTTSMLGALFMKSAFRNLKKNIDYAEYGGAPLLGIDGNVIICHGKSNAKAIKNAINQAIISSEYSLPLHILESIERFDTKEHKKEEEA